MQKCLKFGRNYESFYILSTSQTLRNLNERAFSYTDTNSLMNIILLYFIPMPSNWLWSLMKWNNLNNRWRIEGKLGTAFRNSLFCYRICVLIWMDKFKRYFRALLDIFSSCILHKNTRRTTSYSSQQKFFAKGKGVQFRWTP